MSADAFLMSRRQKLAGRALVVVVLLLCIGPVRSQTPYAKCVRTLEGHDGPVHSVAVMPDGKTIISGGRDRTIRVWNLETGVNQQTLRGFKGEVLRVASLPPLKKTQRVHLFLAGTNQSGDQVMSFESKSWQKTSRIEAYAHGMSDLTVSRDGHVFAVSGGNPEVNVFDVATGQKTRRVELVESTPVLGLSHNGKLLAYAAADNSFRLHDLVKLRPLGRYTGHTDAVTALAFSPDGKRIASSSQDSTVRTWEVDRPTEIQTKKQHEGRVNAVIYSPDGKRVVSAGEDGLILVWPAEGNDLPDELKSHSKAVTSLAFSLDGKILVSGGADGLICVWRRGE